MITIPPPDQDFNGRGFVYTVEYECGLMGGNIPTFPHRGHYATNVLIHNNLRDRQKVFIKILQAVPTPHAVWLNKEAIEIDGDGAIDIDSRQILDSVLGPGVVHLSKGLVIISHPIAGEPPIALDVRVAYTYLVDSGFFLFRKLSGSKDVEAIPGVQVPEIPIPFPG